MSATHPLRPVFILGDRPAASALWNQLARREGWHGLTSMDLPGRMSRLLWGHQAGSGEAGVSSLVDWPHLVAALRRLSDALISSTTPHGSAYTVDVVEEGELLGGYVRAVWPDALIVAIGSVGADAGFADAEPDLWVSCEALNGDLAAVVEQVAAAAAASVIELPGPPDTSHVVFDPARSPLHGRVIVVLGAARSGTTWLHRLLSASPDVVGTETGETWLFPDVAPLWADEVRAVAGDDLTLAALRSFCDDLLSGLLRRTDPSATYVCEKTPTTVWQLPLLTRLYPDAHYVHIVRDGRDVAASLALTRGEHADPQTAAREWVEAVGAIRAAAPTLATLDEVRYEELLEDPRGVVERLWRQIGVPVTGDAVAELERRVGERVTPLPASGEIGTGKWRQLSDADRTSVARVTASLLRELGYPADAS